MALRFAPTTTYAQFIEPRAIGRVVAAHLMEDNKVIFINEAQTGMVFGFTSPFVWGASYKTATEMLWWVEPEERNKKLGKQLIVRLEAWAREQGCKLLTLTSLDSRVGRMYTKAGFKIYERTYIKEL